MDRPSAEYRIHSAANTVRTAANQTGARIPKRRNWARRKPGGRLVIQAPEVALMSPPFKIDSMPRVTTMAGMRAYATSAPLTASMAIPAAMEASHATQMGYPRTASVPEMVASTPMSDPTETSMWPAMMTMDIPIAATATYACPEKMLVRSFALMKRA